MAKEALQVLQFESVYAIDKAVTASLQFPSTDNYSTVIGHLPQ
jgi:hypothetical protein